MAQPTAYNRNEDFTQRPGDETNHTALNTEFDAAAQSINQIRSNLALLQADSGGLKPGIVGPDQLSQAARDSLIPDVAQATADAQAAASSAVASATAANSANAAAQAAKAGAETAASAAALNAQAALAAAQSLNAENLLQKSQNLNDLPDKAAARFSLGLGNVNNTSDADKPISIAGQNALNSKAGITGASGSLIIPAGPTANRDPSPQPGYKRWNTDLGIEETYNGTGWVFGGACINLVINGDFRINQRAYVSGGVTTNGQYTLDRWKVSTASGITFATSGGKTTVTVPAGQTLTQVIESSNVQAGNYIFSWEGSAVATVNDGANISSGSVVYLAGGSNVTLTFGAGTVSNVQMKAGSVLTPFESRPIQTEWQLCRWYFRAFEERIIWNGYAAVGTVYYPSVHFEPMRAVPTVSNLTSAGNAGGGFYATSTNSQGRSHVVFQAQPINTTNSGLVYAGFHLSAEL